MVDEDVRSREDALLLTDLSKPNKPPAVPHKSGKYTNGWRSTVVSNIVLGVVILIINLALAIWIYADYPVKSGVATIYRGHCDKTKNVIIVLHLAICILSTLLLGASSYCIQVLTAPTRHEIDAAHARHKSLSIGVTGLDNLFYLDRKKSVLCFLLAVSSIPLHLLWNSAFLDTLSSNDYIYNAVTESFLAGSPWNTSRILLDLNQYPDEAQEMLDGYKNGSLMRMDVADCIKAYGVTFNSEYSHVLLVYATANGPIRDDSLLLQGLNYGNDTMSGFVTGASAGQWMCRDSGCNFGRLAQDNASSWNPWEDTDLISQLSGSARDQSEPVLIQGSVQYCLAESPWRPCQIDVSPPIIIVVLICNAIKIICFVSTLWLGGSMYPIMTNGDAIQAFLLQPDRKLQNRCLASKADVKHNKEFWSEYSIPMQWRGQRKRWAEGATKRSWLATFIPALILIIAILGICVGNNLWEGGTSQIASQGFGRPSTSNLVGGGIYKSHHSPAAASLLANTPQIIVSYIYLAYNNLFTNILATAEFLSYSVRPQYLRVAWARGRQQSRKFLQVPYLYGIPILTASTILHWLISQSLFLVRITIFDTNGIPQPDLAISTTGYSPLAIIFALCLGGLMLLTVLLLGLLRRFPATMPLAACSSASIMALCQPQEDLTEQEVTMQKLQWGVVSDRGLEVERSDVIGHASFSAHGASPLISGNEYA